MGRDADLRGFGSLLRNGEARGVVLVGAAGVGKTRLARAFVSVAGRWCCTMWVAGTRAGASIPFGPFAPFLPEELPDEASPLELFRSARAGVLERAGRRERLVLAVDDAHLLDDSSATLVHQLVMGDEAFVILTLRSGQVPPEPVQAVVRDERVEWLDVKPLTAAATKTLVEQLLGGPVDGSTMQQLWERTAGNPLCIRELVRSGREQGALVREGHVWHGAGQLTVPSRLREALAARIRSLPERERQALACLATAERFELGLLQHVHPSEALEMLERQTLISVHRQRRRSLAVIAHPLYAEVARAEAGQLSTRRAAGALADQLERVGMRRRDDLLRWATWQLESGRSAHPSRLIAAARRAKAALEPRLAERCADAALACGGGFEARLLRVEALSAQGHMAEAGKQFEQLAEDVDNDAQRAQVALAHSTGLLFQLGDARALKVLQAAAEVVDDPAWTDELEAMTIFAEAYLGDLPRAAEDGRRLIIRSQRATAPLLRAAVIHTYALVLMGRYCSAEQSIEQGLEAARRHRTSFPIGEHLLQVNRVFGLHSSGRIREAEMLAREQYGGAVTADALDLKGLWATNLGVALTLRGRLDDATEFFDEAIALLRERDPVGMFLLALSLAAQAHAMNANPGRARALVADYEEHAQDRTPAFGTVWRHRVDAWLQPLPLGAASAQTAMHAGRIGMREHQVVFGSLALHDAVRFGHPGLVVDGLDAFAAVAEGELIPALAAHGHQLHDQHPEGLEDVSQRFAAMGADLYAAEASAQASYLHAQHGAVARAAATRQRALALARGGVRCPTLWQWIDRPGALTDREYEIAALAAGGFSDREIAQRLVISPRTVGNHLTSVYQKLGITGRHDLTPVLQPHHVQ